MKSKEHCVLTHTHIHTHMHTQTCTHTHTCTHIHTTTHTHTHTNAHTHTHNFFLKYKHKCKSLLLTTLFKDAISTLLLSLSPRFCSCWESPVHWYTLTFLRKSMTATVPLWWTRLKWRDIGTLHSRRNHTRTWTTITPDATRLRTWNLGDHFHTPIGHQTTYGQLPTKSMYHLFGCMYKSWSLNHYYSTFFFVWNPLHVYV